MSAVGEGDEGSKFQNFSRTFVDSLNVSLAESDFIGIGLRDNTRGIGFLCAESVDKAEAIPFQIICNAVWTYRAYSCTRIGLNIIKLWQYQLE